jgi:hypothetical protein
MYVVDERQVAEAILLRRQAHGTLPRVAFGNERSGAAVRSFRLEHEARSFRLGGRPMSRRLHH